jgi:putative spermidine/putrescine transport system ATP-binding protein
MTPAGDLELTNVSKRFGQTLAVEGINLRVPHGSYCCLLGPSGCGKTTLLRLMAGHETPTTGDVRIGGESVLGLPPLRRGTAMMFQHYALFPHLTVLENVAFTLKMRGMGKAERRRRAHDMLAQVQMDSFAERLPAQLSGGQQQRVALARALAVAPQVLLLDEPLSALDAQVRVQLREEIRRIQLELGITTVFVTHDQAEALSVADRVGVLRAGRLEQVASPDELYERPATAFVAEFVGTMNRLPATLRDGEVELLGTRRPLAGAAPPAGPVVALVRPEALLVTPDGGAGRVVTRTFSGASTRVLVALPDGTEVRVDVASATSGDLLPGTAVTVTPAERPVLVAPAEPESEPA